MRPSGDNYTKFPVNAELIYVRLKTRWPLHRLQVRYFKPINVGYHSLPVIRSDW